MKKILLVSLEFPPFKGGVANYYYNLCKNFPTNKIVVLTEKQPAYPEKFKIIRKILVSKIPIWPRWLSGLVKTFIYARSEKIEVFWAGQILPLGTICLFLKKILNLPYFVSCHGTDLLTAIKNPRKKILVKKIIANASFVTANSEFTKNIIKGLGVGDNKITIIHPCPNVIKNIDPLKIKQLEDKYKKNNTKILLSVGRLVPRKNFAKVIKVIPEIIKTHPNIIYLIIGNGPDEIDLKNLITKTGLDNKVKLLTNVNDEELSYFFNLCDIFILIPIALAGEIEGFGMVYLEAGSYGKPVIASRSGGVADAVYDQKSGILVNADSETEIKAAITKLLNQPDLAYRLGIFAKDYIQKKFQWSEQANKLVKSIFEKII